MIFDLLALGLLDTPARARAKAKASLPKHFKNPHPPIAIEQILNGFVAPPPAPDPACFA